MLVDQPQDYLIFQLPKLHVAGGRNDIRSLETHLQGSSTH